MAPGDGPTIAPNPTVSQRKLRTEVRQLREEAHLKLADVAGRLRWSPSKLSRIESGSVTISVTDLRALLHEYRVEDDAKVKFLEELAAAARTRQAGWGEYRGKVSEAFFRYLTMESAAHVVRNFEPSIIPGLLQTPEYSRAVITSTVDEISDSRLDELAELRERRRSTVFAPDSTTQCHFIIDESALRRQVGGPGVLRRQLESLREQIAADSPRLTVRVVPFTRGAYPGFQRPYVIIELPAAVLQEGAPPEPERDEHGRVLLRSVDPDQQVLFLEDDRNELVIQENDEGGTVALDHLGRFWLLADLLGRPQDSLDVVDAALRDVAAG